MLLSAQATAATHHRYIIEPGDLPITQGLQENIDRFTGLAQGLDLDRILAQLATYRPLDRIPVTETKARFPDIVGGLTVALARTFTLIDPEMTHPRPAHWDGWKCHDPEPGTHILSRIYGGAVASAASIEPHVQFPA
ncbi:DUF1931 family protein [Rhodococcus sp. IEGM 248]|nr:DUF1931 family protein [Rhodococcus sp. IEGM 248]